MSGRARLVAAAIVALDAAWMTLVWPGLAPVNDYAGFVAGGKALLAGVDPYDASTWRAFALSVGQRPDTDVFGYPPWVAIAFVPLAALPTPVGSALWTLGGMALAAVTMAALARRHGWHPLPGIALALVSWPALLQIVQGQWGFVLLALATYVLLDLESGHDARAGTWWALALLAKPQLFVVASFALATWVILAHRARVLLALVLVVAAGVAAGTLVAPHWLGPYVLAVMPARASRLLQQPTLAGLAGDLAGEAWPVVWLLSVLALGAVVAWSVRRAPAESRGPLALGGVLALSVATSPYSWSYDTYLAVPLGAATVAVATRRSGRSGLLVAAAVAVLFGPLALLLFESAYLRWHDTLAGLVPVIAIALSFVAVSRARRVR